jgi:alkylation response protein AidB-like acyl-CoA dehydrogenase
MTDGKFYNTSLNAPNNIEDFRDYVRAFIDREIAPHADQWTRERSIPKTLHASAGQAGLFGLKYSAAWGGSNRPYGFTHVMLDEFGRSGSMGCLLSLALQSEFSTPHLALYGGEALQRRFLAPAIAGTCILAIAMTEPEGGSDLANLRTIATQVDGGYRVSGRKWMIGNASLADAFCVACRASDQVEDQLPRITMLLVEATTPGFSVVRQLEKTGLHATPNCEILFDDCFVPHENVLGRPGLAIPQGLVANAYERVALAIIAMGAMRAGWESAVRFLGSRTAGDRALLERSPWRHRLTQDYLLIEGAERIVKDAAASLEGGRPDHALVLMAKIAATEACREVLERASQAHGARGFLAEERIGRLYADARALTIGGGATEALVEALSRIVLPPVIRSG